MKSLLKTYPLTLLTLLAVFYLSFFTPPKVPDLEEINYIDKWTHLVMYGGLSLVFLYENKWRPNQLFALWLPSLLGGVIEVLQEYCTNHRRSGEVADWIADTLGSLLVYGVVYMVFRKRNK